MHQSRPRIGKDRRIRRVPTLPRREDLTFKHHREVAALSAAERMARYRSYEAGRKAGYEAGYNKGYDEGFQMGLEAKTPPEPEPPPPKSES
jgi:flagellar biosynthesis/type III secretory pathway protein FliH